MEQITTDDNGTVIRIRNVYIYLKCNILSKINVYRYSLQYFDGVFNDDGDYNEKGGLKL